MASPSTRGGARAEGSDLGAHLERLTRAQAQYAERFPGPSGDRQPVHTVYGGAHLFRADTPARLGRLALAALDEYAPDAESLGAVVGLANDAASLELAGRVHARVREKLSREPVEDFRIDFEDGYGHRPDEEEDGHAASAALELARGVGAGTAPPFSGIRIKSLSAELGRRALTTLGIFVRTLVEATEGSVPAGFVVTLPKILHPDQVSVLAEALAQLERELGLASGALRLELMIETPQSVFAADGRVALPVFVAAANGRMIAAHFGTYDYTASLGITAEHQHMAHPGCDFAKHVMQVALAGTGMWISDGATNVLPVPLHRRAAEGPALTAQQVQDNRNAVHSAWRLHATHVRHSLEQGFYQGWDLHPAQLVTRYATLYTFFLAGLDLAAERLRNFVAKAAQATLVGDVFDDAATGQGLLNHFLRATACGALDEEEAKRITGLEADELATRSFPKILEARKARG